MEKDGKQKMKIHPMFFMDSCPEWPGGGGNGGAMIELVATEVEKEADGEEEKRKSEWGVELGKAMMVGDGDGYIEKAIAEEQVPENHTQTERDRRKRMRTMYTTLHDLVPHLPSKADKTTIVEESVNYIRILQHRLQILQDKKREKLMQLKNNGIGFNPFAPSSSSFIQPQNQLSQQQLSYEHISREAFLADHYYNFSSSASVTPQNSYPTTPKINLSSNNNNNSPLGSSIMEMINNIIPKEPAAMKLSLPPSSIMFKTYTSNRVVVNVCGLEAQFNICGARKPGFYTGICSVLEKFQLAVKSFHISSDEQSNLTMVMIQVTTSSQSCYPMEEISRLAGAEMMLWVSS